MARLRVQLFKNLVVLNGEGRAIDMGSPTTRALFAYLALNYREPVDRRRLAFSFWTRSTEAAARRNLRQYLHRLRRAVEPVDPDDDLIATDGNSVQLRPPADWWLDVAAFEQAIEDGNLEEAVELYGGPLLPEVYDEWVEPERERLAHCFRQALLDLIAAAEDRETWTRAARYAERYLEEEPLREGMHLRLMTFYYAMGDRARVQEQYETVQEWLERDLGTTPLPETTAAYEAMMAGTYERGAPGGAQATEIRIAHSLPLHGAPSDALLPAGEGTQPPLIGRVREVAWLQEAFAAAESGQGGITLVQGESGIGKTRLVSEWLEGIEDRATCLAGRCHEFESMLPYAPLAEALRRATNEERIPWERFEPPSPWLAALQPFLPDLYERFPQLEAAWKEMGGRHHVVEAMGNFLLTLAAQQPVVLFLDNLHWADPPTWDFLGYLAPRAAQTSLLIVVTARMEDVPQDQMPLLNTLERRGWLQSHRLPRLSEEETTQLVRALTGDEEGDAVEQVEGFSRRFITSIYRETEGNPFFIIETIRAVREAGGDQGYAALPSDWQRRPALPIPQRVQAVIQGRLDKLCEESRMALGVAAAIGREFSFTLLQEIGQYETVDLLNMLDEWLARGLVRERRDAYDFTHEKLSQVAYSGLTRARRQWTHGHIARFLERTAPETDPAKLAHHYYHSDEPEQALPYLIQAGERALRIRSYAEARGFGLRAIGLLSRFPRLKQSQQAERIDLNLQVAQAYAFTGALTQALELLRETENLATALGDTRRLVRIFQRSAQIFWLRGRAEEANDYARRVLRHAEELDDEPMRVAALRMLGRTCILLGRYDDAIAYLLRYLDLTTAGLDADLPVIHGYLGVAYARVGSWQRAVDAAARGVEMAPAEGTNAMHVVARMQQAFVFAELGEWERALEVAEPVGHLWREEGMSPHAFMLRSVMGRALVHCGQQQAGLAEIKGAVAWAREVNHRLLVHVVYLHLAQIQVEAGAYREAQEMARTAAALAKRAGDRWAEAVAWRTEAQAEMRLPQPDWPGVEAKLIQARGQLRRIRTRPDLARTYLAMRRLYDRAGRVAWAVDCHFRATTIFVELGMERELREAQGRPAVERGAGAVMPGLQLRGPNVQLEEAPGLT